MNDSVYHNNLDLVGEKDGGILTSELEEEVVTPKQLSQTRAPNDSNSNEYQSGISFNSRDVFQFYKCEQF